MAAGQLGQYEYGLTAREVLQGREELWGTFHIGRQCRKKPNFQPVNTCHARKTGLWWCCEWRKCQDVKCIKKWAMINSRHDWAQLTHLRAGSPHMNWKVISKTSTLCHRVKIGNVGIGLLYSSQSTNINANLSKNALKPMQVKLSLASDIKNMVYSKIYERWHCRHGDHWSGTLAIANTKVVWSMQAVNTWSVKK